jgi:hypothetical protein
LRETTNPRDLSADLLRNHHEVVHGHTNNDLPKEISSISRSNLRMIIHQKSHMKIEKIKKCSGQLEQTMGGKTEPRASAAAMQELRSGARVVGAYLILGSLRVPVLGELG